MSTYSLHHIINGVFWCVLGTHAGVIVRPTHLYESAC